MERRVELYYIVSLHQTTTVCSEIAIIRSCIISFLYIKPQLICICGVKRIGCIISFLYIKPQLGLNVHVTIVGCIISFLYIKPQPMLYMVFNSFSCIISFLYIKPQRTRGLTCQRLVVLYRFSTSNHNYLV